MKRKNICLLLSVLVLVSCSLSCAPRRGTREIVQPVPLPREFSSSGQGQLPDHWWEDFDDPELTGLINRALSDNFTLKGVWSRFDQAYSLHRMARAARAPLVSLDAGAGRARSVVATSPIYSDQFSLNLATSYEIDLWGKLESLEAAAQHDLKASRGDVETMAMTLAAQVAGLWFSIIEQQAHLDLLAAQLTLAQTYLDLVELRFSQGMASALDVYQQRQQVVSTRAKIPLSEARLKVQQHQLATLLARPPNAEICLLKNILPDLPPLPESGILADLMERRPDLRAARERVESADQRVAAAASEQLATLRITGRSGYQNSEAGDLFELWNGSITAATQLILADGGRREADLNRSRAVTTAAIHSYAQAVLQAMQEVENSLVQENKQGTYLEALEEQLAITRETLEEARARYINGLNDYLPVLVALQSLQQLERTILTARRELISYRVQLYQALGGSWTTRLQPPVGSAEPVVSGEND